MLNRLNAVLITRGATDDSKRVGVKFIAFIGDFAGKARGKIGVAWRFACREAAGSGMERPWRGSACCGLPLFLRFSGNRSFHGGARIRKARRRGNNVGYGRLRFREQSGGRVEHCADHFGGSHGRRLQGLMMVEHPTGEHGFGGLLDPLVHQGGNFLAQIRRMVEPGQLKALQRGARGRLQIVERRSESRYGHDQGSNQRAGPNVSVTESLKHCTELSRTVSSPSLWICCG